MAPPAMRQSLNYYSNLCCVVSAEVNEDPCKSHRCLFGARCVPASHARTSTCRCDWRCDDLEEAPVCGEDGRGYSSECHLRQSNCLAMVDVQVKYNGSCGMCDKLRQLLRDFTYFYLNTSGVPIHDRYHTYDSFQPPPLARPHTSIRPLQAARPCCTVVTF